MVSTGTQVEIMPVPMPLMMTVAAPVCEEREMSCVGRNDCEV